MKRSERRGRHWLLLAALVFGCGLAGAEVRVTQGSGAREACAAAPARGAAAAGRPSDAALLPDSVAVAGERDLRWVWLSSPTRRYGHAALGSNVHAASLHAVLRNGQQVAPLLLDDDAVIEDRTPRLADLDGDGRDEVIVVEAHQARGASLVVYGVDSSGSSPRWVERARGAPMGRMRWLNPVGVADFDRDGRVDIAAVHTPHIGGVLTLYRYAPPHLQVLGQSGGVSNHRMGASEQGLSAVLRTAQGPLAVVPDAGFARLLFLRWGAARTWEAAAAPWPLPAPLARVLPRGDVVCVELASGDWSRIALE